MPGIILFRRRWEFGSDDLVFPGIFEILVRTAWLILIVVVFHQNLGAFSSCPRGHLLTAYYIGTLLLLGMSLLLSAFIVYTSAKGSMTNIQPRRKIPCLLYIKFGLGLPELIWNIIGSYWAFSESSGCDSEVVNTVKAAVICAWIAFFLLLVSMLIVFDPLGRPHAYDQPMREQQFLQSGDGEQFMQGASSAALRVWETRCKILCCFVGCDEQSQAAFSDIAKLMSQFFQDVDLVPTDLAAGMILLHRDQKQKRSLLKQVVTDALLPNPSSQRGATSVQESADCSTNSQHPPKIDATIASENSESYMEHLSETSAPLDPCPTMKSPRVKRSCPLPKTWMSVGLITHYMKYAMASYGWPLYVFSNLTTGLCKLYPHCRCCNCMYAGGSVVQDNTCQCHTAAIRRFTGVQGGDLIYASFHNRIYEIPFFVCVDREHNAVVISIRGTLSLKDALTDLTTDCDDLYIEGVSDCYAHKGILSAASFIHQQLERLQLLEQAFQQVETADLVVCGHSLGAGAAVLLSVLLRPKYPDIHCYAYSPPGGLLSPSACELSQQFVVSVVLGKDLIPRLGLITIEDLKMKLLKSIRDCHIPKYKVLLGGCWQVMCGVSTNQRAEGDSSQASLNRPLLDESNNTHYAVTADSSQDAIRDSIMASGRSKITHPPLMPPGQLLHIVEIESRKSWFGTPRYMAVWSCCEAFDEILVSPKMVSDHLPDAVMRALEQLDKRNFTPHMAMREKGQVQAL